MSYLFIAFVARRICHGACEKWCYWEKPGSPRSQTDPIVFKSMVGILCANADDFASLATRVLWKSSCIF